MLVIGLTGPSGAGKSEVARVFAKYGVPVINADEVYHKLLQPPSFCLAELTDYFGTKILFPDGTLNRVALGNIVFSNPNDLQALNSITHRYIMEEIRMELEDLRSKNYRAAVLDAPQLFEAGAHHICNTVVSVLAQRSIRLERIMARDHIDAQTAMRRMESQKSDEYFRSHSDYIIENNTTTDHITPDVEHILRSTGVIGF